MTAVIERDLVLDKPSRGLTRSHPGALVDVVLACVFVACLFGRDNPSAMWLAIVLLLSVPGDLLRRATGVEVASVGERLVYAVAGSVATQIAVSMIVEGLSLLMDAGRPFATGPMMVGEIVALGALLLSAHREGAAPPGPSALEVSASTILAAVTSLVLVMIGVPHLDNGNGPSMLLVAFALIAASVIAVLCNSRRRLGGDLVLLVYALSLAVLWSFSLRSQFLYGFDIHQEYAALMDTVQAGVWVPKPGNAFNSVLSLTSVPAGIHALTGIGGLDLFKVAYPALFALFPTATFLLLRRYAGPLVSLCLTLVLALNPAGFWQISAVVRQEVALVVFAALILLLLVGGGSARSRFAFGTVLGVACVLAHYSTSYVAIALLAAGVVGGWLLSRLGDGSPERRVPWLLPVVMAAVAIAWNVGLNDATQNVENAGASYRASGGGLEPRASWWETWLDGTNAQQTSAAKLFADSRDQAEQRSWLQPYSPTVQADFDAIDAVAAPVPAAVPSLLSVVDVSLTALRQLTSIFVVICAAALSWRILRRRGATNRGERWPTTAVALAVSGCAIAVVMRLSTALSLSYNAERLATQLSIVIGLSAALVLQRLLQGQGLWRRFTLAVLSGAAVLAFLDVTGVRAIVVGGTAGNLQTQGEHVERYFVTDQDAAAAAWLSPRFVSTNMVYTDRYGALVLRDDPKFARGLLDLVTPALLDQRAFVLATTENMEGGRARGYLNGEFAVYEYPREFLMKYKALVYSNGAAVIFD